MLPRLAVNTGTQTILLSCSASALTVGVWLTSVAFNAFAVCLTWNSCLHLGTTGVAGVHYRVQLPWGEKCLLHMCYGGARMFPISKCMCMCVCVLWWVHEVRGQLCEVGSLFPPLLEFGALTLAARLAGQAPYPLSLLIGPRVF